MRSADRTRRRPSRCARPLLTRSTATSASSTYDAIHHFYDQLCPSCAELNFAKRTELADLRGRVALLTGGRVKIGYQAGLKLLRSGAHLIVTHALPARLRGRATRASRTSPSGADRLEVFGLDLRHTPSVEAFCRELLATRDRARLHRQQRVPDRAAAAGVLRAHDGGGDRGPAATCRRTSGSSSARTKACAAITCCPKADASARRRVLEHRRGRRRTHARRGAVAGAAAAGGARGTEGLCSRRAGSIRICSRSICAVAIRGGCSLAEVPTVELLEVQLVNAVAPFVLNARLKPLMLRTAGARQTHRQRVGDGGAVLSPVQDDRHPHTNMAKAALNMMTRTSATDYHARRHPHEQRRHRLGHRRGSGRDRRAQDRRASLPPAARHRRRRRAHRRPDHRRLQHRRCTCGASS